VASFRRPLEDPEIRWKLRYPELLDYHSYLNIKGFLEWLMGLEPTTTGITIRKFAH
jgi:hypothetical protein